MRPNGDLTSKEQEFLEEVFKPVSTKTKVVGALMMAGVSVFAVSHVDDVIEKTEAAVDGIGDFLFPTSNEGRPE